MGDINKLVYFNYFPFYVCQLPCIEIICSLSNNTCEFRKKILLETVKRAFQNLKKLDVVSLNIFCNFVKEIQACNDYFDPVRQLLNDFLHKLGLMALTLAHKFDVAQNEQLV